MHIKVRHTLGKDPWFTIGACLALMIAVAFIFGPSLAPYDPHDMSFRPLSPPSSEHWLGVNDGGMDIASELLYGLRNTVVFGLLTAAVGLVLGVGTGLTAAWLGGLVDQVTMRAADILMAIPAVMILILVAAFSGLRRRPWRSCCRFFIGRPLRKAFAPKPSW